MISIAKVTCPACKHAFDVSMSPYDQLTELPCPACGQAVVKNSGDHCVICSYGNVFCLAQQSRRDCCSG